MDRKVENQEILNILQDVVNSNPELRWGQILTLARAIKPERPAKPEQMVQWQNEFYTESATILNRMRAQSE